LVQTYSNYAKKYQEIIDAEAAIKIKEDLEVARHIYVHLERERLFNAG
jgi:hypothetical protein